MLVASVAGLTLTLAACGSDNARSTAGTSSTQVAPTVTPPPVPPGGTDCGSTNLMSGWPTTAMLPTNAYTCIVDAAASGTPARMIVISAGEGSSGRQTADGYDIPNRRVVTWVVLGPQQVQQTTDSSEGGGNVTTEMCTGLSEPADGSPPAGTGCEPA